MKYDEIKQAMGDESIKKYGDKIGYGIQQVHGREQSFVFQSRMH